MAENMKERIEHVFEKEFNKEKLTSLTEEQITVWRKWINSVVDEANTAREVREEIGEILERERREREEEWSFYGEGIYGRIIEKLMNIMLFVVAVALFVAVVIVGPVIGLYKLYYWLF